MDLIDSLTIRSFYKIQLCFRISWELVESYEKYGK